MRPFFYYPRPLIEEPEIAAVGEWDIAEHQRLCLMVRALPGV
jgi:hypothetical protein